MNFLTMYSWSLQPRETTPCTTLMFVPQTKYLHPRKLYTLDLGLVLHHIPDNNIVKIQDILPTCKILNTFWIASDERLTITLIAETFTILYRGTPFCKLSLLPAECLVPGMLKINRLFYNCKTFFCDLSFYPSSFIFGDQSSKTCSILRWVPKNMF
jgi:hypothetical protein